MAALGSILERKVVQWSLAYLAAAWATLEAIGFMADLFGWGRPVVRSAAVLLAAGLGAVVVVSWFHGERGKQRVTRLEAGLLAAVFITGLGGAVLVGAAPEAPVADHEVGLAVLPPTGGAESDAYFTAGMHEGLISKLGELGALRVISRRSTLRYDESDLGVPQIASELGVDALVESAVTRTADSVRLRVRLIRAVPEERLVWSGEFGASIREVLAVHGEVARSIARQVQVEITADQQTRLATSGPVDPQTYEAYLKGMHALNRRTPEGIRRGIELLHEAVARSPGDALAYAGLALGYATLGHGPAPPPDAWARASEAAERAVGLDPALAAAHAALADVRLYYEWDWEGAEQAFRRANDLNPSLAMNRYHYAWYLALMGRLDAAITQHTMAKQLDPLTPLHTGWLGQLFVWAGQPERGAAEARQALELSPSFRAASVVLGRAYLALGREEDAIAVHRRLADDSPALAPALGTTLARTGRIAEARRIRDRLEAGDPTPWTAYGLVRLNAHLGDYDRAFRWLGHEPPHAFVPWIAVDPGLSDLRRDPRFRDFLQRLDLPRSAPRVARR